MLFKIKIKELGNRYYDLTKRDKRKELYDALDSLEDPFSYSVVDLKTDEDWAIFDSDTNLDDVVAVMTELKKLTNNQYEIFIQEVKQRIESPMDVILRIK